MSLDEFSNLLESTASFTAENSKNAQRLLAIYFRKPLKEEEINLLVKASFGIAQNLWLNAAKKRKLYHHEILYMIKYMPWNVTRSFPAELPEFYLAELFSGRDPYKIVSYCRSYVLPEKFEQLLIDEYRKNLLNPDEKMQILLVGKSIDGWAKALGTYIEFDDGSLKRFKSKELQKQIIDLNNPKMTAKLASCCNIIQKYLHDDIVMYLLERNDVETLRIILREGYLDVSFRDLLKEKMPQLLSQFYIALIRRERYLENEYNYDALCLRKREAALVQMQLTTDPEEMADFEEYYIKPFLHSFCLCMLAHIAYYFPDLADDILSDLLKRKK